uniref:Endopeptidase La n=1 Tax=Meloidogyne hapla TaxID=6305 RepID=A0A1I8B034_MELHA
MDEIVKATTAPLKLSKPFATPVSPAFLDNLREIEKAQELNMFPRPQTDVPTFDVTFGTKKVNEMQKQQLENNKQLGVLCRVIFTNELMGDEYLRVVSTDNNAILAQQDPEVKSIALQILGPPSATPRPNTLDYSTLPASIEQLDLKFNTIYEALQLDNSRINYPNFLEIRKKFVRDLINDYLSISGTDPKLKSQEKNFLKELESISKETENARILGNPQNLNDPLILDSSFARRLEQVQKFDKDQGLLIFKQLKGFPIVIDEVKRKLTEAFDTLFKQIQPASNIPQIPNELRQTMADIGKDAITLLKTQTGQPQQPSTSHTGPIQIEVIERNYREFYMKRLHDKLHVNEMVQYKGLKMRAIEAFKKLNAAYLSIVPSQISPQMHPLVQSSSDSIKEIRTKDKDEDLLGPGPASLDVLDKRYKERLDSLKPLDRNVASLFGLYKAIGFTLKKLGKPYETFGAGELKVEPFLSAIASMHRIEDAIDDWKVFGQNSDFSPIDGKKLDGIYWREVATKIRAPLVYQHLGLRTRGIKALKSRIPN